jgi:transcriptional regulator with XRE-family HTH domain
MPDLSRDIVALVRQERRGFAAKIRVARAVLGWSQSELAVRAGLTQRAVHMLEQGETEPRRATARVIEAIWAGEGLEFEDLTGGGFRLIVRSALLDRPKLRENRRHRDAAAHRYIRASGH